MELLEMEKYLKKNLLDGFNIRLDAVENNKRLSKGKHKEKKGWKSKKSLSGM